MGFRLCCGHMNAAFLEEMKTKLVEERARLEQDLNDMGYRKDEEGNVTVDTESGGNSDDDNASEVTAFADGMSVAERLESELKDVKKALASVEAGTYGICKYCKKPIDEKRLIARPSSSSCIECKKTLTQEL
jgi:DnaK suppressor protein